MAGSASELSLLNSSFFNIYSDGGPLTRGSPTKPLPDGQCNFVDLTHGANGPKCGCRRFWSRAAPGQSGPSGLPGYCNGGFQAGNHAGHAVFCFCSHHACFHDDVRDGQPPVVVGATAANPKGQENERPNREPLTPVIKELSFQKPNPKDQSKDLHTFNNASFSANLQEDVRLPQCEVATPAQEASLPDTLSWANLVQTPTGHHANVLPPIPSQCVLLSQPSSTTSSTRMGYLQPFAGRGLTLKSKLQETQLGRDVEARLQDEEAAEPAMDDFQTVTNTPRSARRVDTSERGSQISPPSGPSHDEFQQLSDTVHAHEERIDKLENASFNNDHGDCHGIHDHTDLRVTELESRVEEVEKILNDSGSTTTSSKHRFKRPGVDESTASVVSVSTNASGRNDRNGLYNELQALKAQLSQLQSLSSYPSYNSPWEVEVVFLPFPLKGVWMQSRDFASQRLSGGSNMNLDAEMRTRLPNSSSMLEPQSPGLSEWVAREFEPEWLLARACAPDRMIEKRLRSRGLVKTVTVRGPDARSVQQAIDGAFGPLFRTFSRMQANAHHGFARHPRMDGFLGLQRQWVPLRKIHKDSRLRFLSPAEMITPATWDMAFLSSSVVMKATDVQRLFLTQPEAYLQDQAAFINCWSWQRLRELNRVYPDSQSSQQATPEADAMEDCWAWNDKLDEQTPSQDSSASLSLRQAAQPRLASMSSSPSPQKFYTSHTGQSPSLSNTRSRAQSPMFAVKGRKPFSKPIHIRTNSMPPVAHAVTSPAPGIQRVASVNLTSIHHHPYERWPAPQLVRASTSMSHALTMAKRRRNTRSPSVPFSARLRYTPRWSTVSPSPMPEGFAFGTGGNGVNGCRQPTPLYYATPYSNAPFVDPRATQEADESEEDRGSGTDSFDMADDNAGEDSENNEEDSDYDGNNAMLDLGHPRRRHDDDEDWQLAQHPLPEDVPWLGIEDEENRDPEDLAVGSSGDHGIDVYVDEDAMSDVDEEATEVADVETASQRSSVPSEYPSTQRAWIDGRDEFRVFEDGEGGH